MPSRWCERCGAWIQGPVNIIEISRLAHAGPELERVITCPSCADAARAFLRSRPEVPALEPVEADLVTSSPRTYGSTS